jgi:hypothetical protein
MMLWIGYMLLTPLAILIISGLALNIADFITESYKWYKKSNRYELEEFAGGILLFIVLFVMPTSGFLILAVEADKRDKQDRQNIAPIVTEVEAR